MIEEKSKAINKLIHFPRVMIAAERSGCGKTTFTCGLLQLLKNRGMKPVSFKCGPDYIDPMFHEKVLGVPSTNLDPYFLDSDILDENCLKSLLKDRTADGNCGVIEGVMGIYDGIYVDSDKFSSYEVSIKTDTNIILMVNGRGAVRTLISVIKGILADDRDNKIKGIILNQLSEGMYQRIKPVLENEINAAGFDARVVGFLPKNDEISISSRYLGLSLPGEIQGLQEQINLMADMIENYVDVDSILEIMESSGMLEAASVLDKQDNEQESLSKNHESMTKSKSIINLAVAKDEAFCFYYKENIEAFEKRGVNIIYFSPLKDKRLPDGISGLLLGGGYPEQYARELSDNKSMLESVKEVLDNGLPCIAECGGFMYLHKSIRTKDGDKYKMVGALDAAAEYTGHLVRFGYFNVSQIVCQENNFQGLVGMKGHEFHYFDSTDNGGDALLEKTSTGKKYSAMMIDGRRVLGYPHLYYNSSPKFVDEFIEVMKGEN